MWGEGGELFTECSGTPTINLLSGLASRGGGGSSSSSSSSSSSRVRI